MNENTKFNIKAITKTEITNNIIFFLFKYLLNIFFLFYFLNFGTDFIILKIT